MKKWNIFILVCFLMPVAVMSVWSLCDTDNTRSETENRMLAAMPELSADAWFSGGFYRDFGVYYSDTFPMRDLLLSGKQTLNHVYLFNPYAASGDGVTLIITGPDGDQIAEGGESIFDHPDMVDHLDVLPSEPPSEVSEPPSESEQPTPTPTPPPPDLPDGDVDVKQGVILIFNGYAVEVPTINEGALAYYAETVNGYVDACPQSRVINIIAPNSAAFNAPADYREGVHDQRALIDYAYERLGESVIGVDAYSELRRHTDEYLYFRTDHHWTQLGAYYTYRAFCEDTGLTPFELDDFETGQIDDFVGSMYTYTKANPGSSVLRDNPDTVYTWRPIRDFSTRIYPDLNMKNANSYGGYVISNKITVQNKYLAFISGDNPLMVISTDVDNGRSCVVIKESYGNAFVPYLVNHYSTVYVVDPRKFNDTDKPSGNIADFVNERAIDDIIIINYPMAVNNNAYSNLLKALIK